MYSRTVREEIAGTDTRVARAGEVADPEDLLSALAGRHLQRDFLESIQRPGIVRIGDARRIEHVFVVVEHARPLVVGDDVELVVALVGDERGLGEVGEVEVGLYRDIVVDRGSKGPPGSTVGPN